MAQGNIWQLLSALGEMVSDDGSGSAAPKSQPTEQTVSAKVEQRTAHAVMLGGVPSTYEMMLLRHPCDSLVIPPEGDRWFLVSLHPMGSELSPLVGLWARPPSTDDTD